jgi:long-chain acyl-CoA synthetase
MLLPNCPEFHIIDMAIMSIGATPISLYPTASAEQIDHIVTDAGAFLAIAFDDNAARTLWSSQAVRDLNLQIIVVKAQDASTPHISLAQLENSDPIDLDACVEQLNPHSEATIIYTSGTTGPSKGVMLSHRNILWATESLRLALGDRDLAGKRIISYLPMAHIAERSTSHYSAVSAGYEVTTCADPATLAEHLTTIRPHLLFGVPRVWEKLRKGVENVLAADPEQKERFVDAIEAATAIRTRIANGEATDEDRETLSFLDVIAFAPVRSALGLDHIEIAVTGAAPTPPETLQWFRAIGIPMTEIYGMSETAGPIAWTSDLVEAGTIGPAIPGSEVRLGDDGEILFRGGNVFMGYLGRDDATAETIDEAGWLHTGDIGVLDDLGHLRVIDRKKELIVTAGGKNIAPVPIEKALEGGPIGQAVVIGSERPYLVALLCTEPDVPHDEALRRAIAARVEEVNRGLARTETIKRWALLPSPLSVEGGELTPTLKLRRRVIIERHRAQIEALYAP